MMMGFYQARFMPTFFSARQNAGKALKEAAFMVAEVFVCGSKNLLLHG